MSERQPAEKIEVEGVRYISTSWLCNYLINFADKLKESNLPQGAIAMENLCAGILLEDLRWEK